MTLTEIIARLEEVAKPPLTSIEGAEELDALGKGIAVRSGATFVLPHRDIAEENPFSTGSFRQHVHVSFLVAVAIRRADDAKGGQRVQAVDTFRLAIESALAGWSSGPEFLPCELVEANAATGGNGVTWYVQTWRTDRWIEA